MKLFTLRPGSGRALESVTEAPQNFRSRSSLTGQGHPDKLADQRTNGHRARIRAIEKKVVPVLRRAGVRRAALFGSVVSGNFRRASDVDLLIDFRGRKTLLDFVGLKHDLEETLGRKVDLVTYRSLHPLLRDRILKQQLQIL